MPYLDSNIPSKIFYASIASEVVRIARTTMDLINMVKRKSKLQVNVPVSIMKKVYGKHSIKYFISFQIEVTNWFSSSLCNCFCVCVWIFYVYLYVFVFYVCNLFVCAYVAVYFCCTFPADCCWNMQSFRMLSYHFSVVALLRPMQDWEMRPRNTGA